MNIIKLVFIAALVAVSFVAKAQTIKIISSCRELPRIVSFQREAANGDVFQRYTLGSVCPAREMPTNRLDVGHYQFDDMPIRAKEEFLVLVQEKGVTVNRDIVTRVNNSLFVSLGVGQDLVIIISEKLECNCSAKN